MARISQISLNSKPSTFTLQRYEIFLIYANNNAIIFNKKAHFFRVMI